MDKEKIIVALDVNNLKEVEKLVDILSPYISVFKVGMELFYSCGPKAIDIIKKYDREIFLDLKFHDIPNTVHSSAKAAVRMGVFMFNVHVAGGVDMMKRALDGAEEESQRLGISRPKILGVTVLTSIDQKGLHQIGIIKCPEEQVLTLAELAEKSGLDGVVASPKETARIREKIGRDFVIVTPGVRPEGSEKQDQKRTSTPKQAIQEGADYIVIGRPVTKSNDPVKAVKAIL